MAAKHKSASSSTPGPMTNTLLDYPIPFEPHSTSRDKPVVIGLYGIPGSGKTTLLNSLKQELSEEKFAFYEGSQVIDTLVPDGLDGFKKIDDEEKMNCRIYAMDTIGHECSRRGNVGVVTGHFMFWPEEDEVVIPVYTQSDLNTFTHIIYLDVRAEVVMQQSLADAARRRPFASVDHLCKWQETEISQLHRLCRQHGILFTLLSTQEKLVEKTLKLLEDFQHHTEKQKLSLAEIALDKALGDCQDHLKTMLVLDGDRTLAAEDTGTLFWQKAVASQEVGDRKCPLETLFSGPLGYTYTAFRQATLMYEHRAAISYFDTLCQKVAWQVTMYPEFISLLREVGEQEHVGAVVVTCGLHRVWEMVLEREGLSKKVKVIGGGRIGDGYVVAAEVKTASVQRLRENHEKYVWAFGDSPLDLGMLKMADQAIVVVGEEKARSKSMDVALMNAIDNDGLQARQVVLPKSVSSRIDTTKLPLVQFTEPKFVDSILRRQFRPATLEVFHATDKNAAKLLMMPMRDAALAGPALREAHRRVGWYLTINFLAELIGVEEFQIPHVQGHQTTGYQLRHEQQTTILVLMRGGEPMALGVCDALPLAMFAHANSPEDIKLHHLQGQSTVLLVDSVVNSGKTMAEFVTRVRSLHATVHIVIVAGVAQAQSVSAEGSLVQALSRRANMSLVALRLSENKFTGRGTTDTGNRLFNTTQLP